MLRLSLFLTPLFIIDLYEYEDMWGSSCSCCSNSNVGSVVVAASVQNKKKKGQKRKITPKAAMFGLDVYVNSHVAATIVVIFITKAFFFYFFS
jgi:hypothetical protein